MYSITEEVSNEFPVYKNDSKDLWLICQSIGGNIRDCSNVWYVKKTDCKLTLDDSDDKCIASAVNPYCLFVDRLTVRSNKSEFTVHRS